MCHTYQLHIPERFRIIMQKMRHSFCSGMVFSLPTLPATTPDHGKSQFVNTVKVSSSRIYGPTIYSQRSNILILGAIGKRLIVLTDMAECLLRAPCPPDTGAEFTESYGSLVIF
jgi:hypothetical protein